MLNGMMYKILILFLIFVFGCAKETTNVTSPPTFINIPEPPQKEIIKPEKTYIEWEVFNDQFVQESLDTRQMIFVYIYTDWCPHCTEMEKTTLKNENVIKLLNKNFLSTKINGDAHPNVVKAFVGKQEYPAVAFLYPNVQQNKIMYAGSVIGFIPEDIFIELLEQISIEKQKVDFRFDNEQTSN